MEFSLDLYKPIDYRKWTLGNLAREGVNIISYLNKEELKIWQAAIPYQDQRDDPGQGEMVTHFALQLLQFNPTQQEIVVPAAIMHDIGWYGTDPEEWKKAVKSGNTEGELKRRPHQNRGIGLAGRILEKAGYPEKYYYPIFDIIGDHDTRLLPTTLEGQIVRDADLLWRVTLPNSLIYLPEENATTVLKKLEETGLHLSPPFDLSPVAAQIGKVELANREV